MIKIGFCYDFKEHYGFDPENMDYTDFSTINTVNDIRSAFEKLNYEIDYIGPLNNLIEKINTGKFDCDMIFNITEGINSKNREGLLPAYLEINNIPFSGSDAYPISLTLNKLHTKIMAKELGILTPNYKLVNSIDDLQNFNLKFPIVIKPNYEGGSMGIYLIESSEDLIPNIERLLNQYHQGILCEEYIEGTEITIPVIGNGINTRILGIAAAKFYNGEDIELFTSNLKYFGDIEYTTNFECDKSTKIEMEKASIKLHKFLELNDYSRMDFRLSKDGKPYFLEINPLPALDKDDAFDVCGKSQGLEYYETINLIIIEALKRNKII